MPREIEASGLGCADSLARAAERLQHGQARGAEAGVGDEAGEGGGRIAVRGEGEDARTGMEVRADQVEGAAVEREEDGVGERPPEPRRSEAEGGGRRNGDDLLRRDRPREQRADAVVEGVARGEHADRPAAVREHVLDRAVERARPGAHGAADRAAPASARCRLPPKTISAPSTSVRAAGVSPSIPSSPMPTMASHRWGAASSAVIGSGAGMTCPADEVET